MNCSKCGTELDQKVKFCTDCGAGSTEAIKTPTSSGKQKIAGKLKRLRALFWDLFLPVLPMVIISSVYAVFKVVMFFIGVDIEGNPLISLIFVIAAIGSMIWPFVYWIFCMLQINKTGQSVGKKRVGIKVIDAKTGKTVTIFKYLIGRVVTPTVVVTFASIVPIFYLAIIADFFWVLFDNRSQAIHDKLWGTLVVEV